MRQCTWEVKAKAFTSLGVSAVRERCFSARVSMEEANAMRREGGSAIDEARSCPSNAEPGLHADTDSTGTLVSGAGGS